MDFKFPLFLKNTKENHFYKFSNGNRVLEFCRSSVLTHCGPYIFNTKEEFIFFLRRFTERKEIIYIEEEEFKKELEKALDFIINKGFEPVEYWSKDSILRNIKAIQENTKY